MKFALPILALFVALFVATDAQAIGRRSVVVQKQVVVQRNVVQRVRVQRVVAQPVVVQQFHAVPVQAFVAPSYGVQAFSAGHCGQVQQFNAGCQAFFAH